MACSLYGPRTATGPYSNADSRNKVSTAFASALGAVLVDSGLSPTTSPLAKPQSIGTEFARVTQEFLEFCYTNGFERIRPARWDFHTEATLSKFFQFEHLRDLEVLSENYREQENYWMAAVVSGDYHVTHDVVMYRNPESLASLNGRARNSLLSDRDDACLHTPLLSRNQPNPIAHAAVSTKWTLRSDRAQNVRTEALNLQKHRKGRTPHLVAVTADPLPTRLASVALGTGEIDCVYHVALPEFVVAAEHSAMETGLTTRTRNARKKQLGVLRVLVEGRQLRDIADLPFDLAM
ncbi:NgoMIV family type II restriction endonuclease [Mycolicibacterium porcinum]